MAALALSAAVLWLIVLALPWRPWSTRERLTGGRLERPTDPARQDCRPGPGAITVLIPARDEADTIAVALRSVIGQPGVAGAVVVDDQSADGTGDVAASVPGVTVVPGSDRPPGWSGKLWALQQGLAHVDTPLVLMLDADIELAPGTVAALTRRLEQGGLDQVSVMATLPAGTLPEKLLLPAFVFFFKQLYPFARVNRGDRPLAAAAGGCVLVRRQVLERAGAFAAWKDALIDDCELARRVRAVGGRIWLGLDRGVVSLRRHRDFGSVLDTVRRTGYVQLRHSPLLLAAMLAGMTLLFVAPPAALASGLTTGAPVTAIAGAAGWALMALAYLPQVRFARLAPAWALSLPVAAAAFAFATADAARRHHFGRGAGWKGRFYAR